MIVSAAYLPLFSGETIISTSFFFHKFKKLSCRTSALRSTGHAKPRENIQLPGMPTVLRFVQFIHPITTLLSEYRKTFGLSRNSYFRPPFVSMLGQMIDAGVFM